MTGFTAGGPDAPSAAAASRTRRPGGAAVHALLAQEVDAILEIAEQWGPTDRSHRKLAHRGSYENSVWVSPSTFRRVLDANGPHRGPGAAAAARAETAVATGAGVGT